MGEPLIVDTVPVLYGLRRGVPVHEPNPCPETVETQPSEQVRKILLEPASAAIAATLIVGDRHLILIGIVHRDFPSPVYQLQMRLTVTVDTQTLQSLIRILPRLPAGIVPLVMDLQRSPVSATADAYATVSLDKTQTELLPERGVQQRVITILHYIHTRNKWKV